MVTALPDYRSIEIKRALRSYQRARLQKTHADLSAHSEYAQIMAFFFKRIYAPDDLPLTNHTIRQIQKAIKGKIDNNVFSTVTSVLELHALSESMDERMVNVMQANQVNADFTPEEYRNIYRKLDNYSERIRHIQMIGRVNTDLHNLSHKRLVWFLLKTLRKIVERAGASFLMEYIEEGYTAFRRIKNIDYFVETIEKREIAWHDKLWNDYKHKGTHRK